MELNDKRMLLPETEVVTAVFEFNKYMVASVILNEGYKVN